MGGPHPTFFPDVIKEDGLDYICVGEGDGAFEEFLTCYKNGGDLNGIRNICSKFSNNPVRELLQDIDSLPMPDRSIIFDNTELGRMPLKTFMSSRGCPYTCTYCYNNTLSKLYEGKGTYVRTHSVGRVMDEIRDVRARYPLVFIKFEDDIFGVSKKWLREFAGAYRREVGLPFNCLLRPDMIDDERIELLKEACCRSVTVAIDSANPRVRDEVLGRRMKLDNDGVVEKLLSLKRAGIMVMTNFIIGVPTSSIDDEMGGVDLNIRGHVDFANATILVPYPNTDIWNYCISNRMMDAACGQDIFRSIQKRSSLSCFTEKEKDTQWNISAFYGTMVKFPILKKPLIWVSKNIKSCPIFSLWYTIIKSFLMKGSIYTFRVGPIAAVSMAFKAFKIEMSRMLGADR